MSKVAAAASTAARAVSGVRWGALAVLANLLAQLGFTAVMARLLEPAAFGLMAMAVVALRLFSYVSQAGLGAALVQRREVGEADLRTALGLTLLIGGSASAVLALVAGPIAAFFDQPTLAPVLRALAPNLLLVALGALPLALLRRRLGFKAIAAVETVAYMAGYGGVGVLLAWQGAGVWALVGATLAQSLIAWGHAYALAPHPLRPRLDAARRELLGYGSRFSLVGLLEFASANLPGVAIGRLLGADALGLFSRAWLLANLPVEKATGVLTRVLFPLLSQAQDDRARLSALAVLGVSAVGLAAAAATLALAAAAGPVVALLLGPQWPATVPVVEVLALSVPCIFMSTLAGTVCDAGALLALKARIQLATLLLIALLMLAWRGHGLVGIAWALVAGEALRLAAYGVGLVRALGCRAAELLNALAGVLLAGALAYTLTRALLAALAQQGALVQTAAAGLGALLGLAAGAALWWHALAGSGAADLAARLWRRQGEVRR